MSSYGTISAVLRHKGSQVWSIDEKATVLEALGLMAEKNVGALLVTGDEKAKGILSERDYARNVVLKGKASKTLPVSEIASYHLITVTPSQTIEECMRLMTDKRIRYLPVLEGEKVVGMVSMGDLVRWVISAQTETIIQLQGYITGHYPTI